MTEGCIRILLASALSLRAVGPATLLSNKCDIPSLHVERQPNWARQSLASTVLAPRVAVTSYCQPGCQANVATLPLLNVPHTISKGHCAIGGVSCIGPLSCSSGDAGDSRHGIPELSVPWSLRPRNRAAAATCGRGHCELTAVSRRTRLTCAIQHPLKFLLAPTKLPCDTALRLKNRYSLAIVVAITWCTQVENK